MAGENGKEKTRRLDFGSYRGEVAAEFDDPLFIAAISRPEEIWSRPDAETLLDKRNRVGAVRIPMSSGLSRDIVVKEFPSRGLVRLKSFIQPSKGSRAWQGALALKRRGLETPSPAAYLEKRTHGLAERSFFFASRVHGAEEIRGLLRSLPAVELESLLSGLGRFLSRCHDGGILHRDLSDGNILVKGEDPGGPLFYLLDTNRIRIRRKLGRFRRAKNLIRLGVPSGFQKYFLRACLRDKPPGKALWLWYKLNKSFFAGYVGFKKKLRLRQIARFLRIQ
jgi:serine/threonine protein kinase